LAKTVQVPWTLATSVDYLYPETEGGTPSHLTRLTSGYMESVTQLAMRDPFVHLTFVQVIHLLKPPSVLFQPRIARAVLSRAIRTRASARTWRKTTAGVLTQTQKGYR
jgi:hypothetical protein